jgi:ATP adenylyltransferase
MDRLWTPWRLDYILGPKPDECIFCIPETDEEDRERLILYRGERNFVIMNRYPYNNGHLMVTPYRHVSALTDLEPAESHEMMDLMQRCSSIMWEVFTPDGLNVGLNIGEAAGAGIEEHLHFHLLPRWTGDHSFMAVFGKTMVIPEDLYSAYDRLKPRFDAIANG